jgi:exopolysaccharide production protein ExoZ
MHLFSDFAGRKAELEIFMQKQELYSIQYLRAVASLSVLAFHLTDRYGGSPLVGSSGVDIFFVISGFIMWVTTADRQVTPAEFAKRRIVRIVPNYWIATVATALLVWARPNWMYGHELDLSRLSGLFSFYRRSLGPSSCLLSYKGGRLSLR